MQFWLDAFNSADCSLFSRTARANQSCLTQKRCGRCVDALIVVTYMRSAFIGGWNSRDGFVRKNVHIAAWSVPFSTFTSCDVDHSCFFDRTHCRHTVWPSQLVESGRLSAWNTTVTDCDHPPVTWCTETLCKRYTTFFYLLLIASCYY